MTIENKGRSERELAKHILPVSGTMVGVCTTLIGLVKIVESRGASSHVDEYSAIVALLFLVSAGASYASIRCSHVPRLSMRCEVVADQVFLLGLACIVLIGLFFAYEVI